MNLYYEKSGNGSPLLLLHGNGETHEIYNEAVEILKKHFTVYAIDSRGHGKSPSVEAYHYEEMAEDVLELIMELEMEKPILYGFSDGGIIALLLASKYPDLLSKIIISGANTAPSGMKRGWLFLFRIIYFFNRSPLFKMMLTEPTITKEMLSKIKIPVMITAGEKDIISKKHTEQLHQVIKESQLEIFAKENHGSYIVHSTKIAKYIVEKEQDL